MGWLTDPLALELFQRALVAAVLMGATCGAIGAYVVLRRLAFIGDALSHAVFPGVVLAYVAGVSVFIGAMIAGALTSVAIAVVSRGQRIREDTAIGIFFAGAFALGIVLISTQTGYQRDLSAFLVGDLLGVGWDEIAFSAVTGLAVIGVLIAPPQGAAARQLRPRLRAGAWLSGLRARAAAAAAPDRHDRRQPLGGGHHPRPRHARHARRPRHACWSTASRR